jgi:hypothetical protein
MITKNLLFAKMMGYNKANSPKCLQMGQARPGTGYEIINDLVSVTSIL